MRYTFMVVTLLCVWQDGLSQVMYQPDQIHLSYGNNETEMFVTWSTWDDTSSSLVEYGVSSLSQMSSGTSTKFVDGGAEKRTQYIHKVILTGLAPGQRYFYHCGSNLGWSDLFYFTAMKSGSSWSPRFAVYGDMGNANPQSLPRLQEETVKGMYDAILHVGDFAYDLAADNGRVGDEFMRQIQSIAAYIPYMICVGNHENAYNFSSYKARFNMPRTEDNMFFSFNVGPVHFISISTEFYYFLNYGLMQVVNQFAWLQKDLKKAQKNREKQPWIITYGHRPMYCSNSNVDDCTKNETLTRIGVFGLEKLFYQYGVDLEFWAHEHSYECLWPIYDRTVYNGSFIAPYTNPKAPIHITTGSAGCREDHDGFKKERPYWSAFRNSDYGYTRLTVFNITHLYLEQVSDDKNGEVIDKMWLIKDKHGPY